MKTFTPDRLWPLLVVLAGLLAGAVAVELYASVREGDVLVVSIRKSAAAPGASEGDDEEGEDGGLSALPGRIGSEGHRRARELARRGELKAALAAFAELLKAAPDAAPLWAEAGYWHLVAREPRRAIEALTEARRLTPDDPSVALNLGIALRRDGDLRGAEAHLRHALELQPGYRLAQIALGAVLRRAGRVDEAIAVLEEAAAYGGNEERARSLVALGRAYLAAQRRESAARAFEQAIQWAPAQAEIRTSAARAWLSAGQPQDVARALEILERALELAPDLPGVHAALGRSRELAGQRTAALDAYATALRLEPDYHLVRRRALRLALDLGDAARAREHAVLLLDRAPDEPEHHLLAGLAAARSERIDEARAHYSRAAELMANGYPEALYNLGLLERKAGNLDAAVAAYRRALELQPDYPAAANNLGIALTAAERYDEAEVVYRETVSAHPMYAPAWNNLGRLHLRLRRYADAIESFRGALRASTDDTEAMLNLGVALRREGRITDAIDIYRRLVEVEPRYVSAWYNLGFALERVDRHREALDAFLRAHDVDPDHLPSLEKIAKLHRKLGELDLAATAYADLLDHAPDDTQARLYLARVRRDLGDLDGCIHESQALLSQNPDDEKAVKLLRQCRRRKAKKHSGG